MKKLVLGFIILSALFFSTSCQAVDRAVEDTFKPAVERKTPVNKEESQLKNLVGLFIDESNDPVSPFDILEDAEDKAGFKFSTDTKQYVRNYLNENEIETYLTEEEIIEMLEKKEAEDFLLNPDLVIKLIGELLKEEGWEDAEVEGGRIHIYSDSFNLSLVDPTDRDIADIYIYSKSLGGWHTTPVKNRSASDTETVSVHDLPIKSVEKVMEAGKEILQETGEYKEYGLTSSASSGIHFVSIDLYRGDFMILADVEGTRQDYRLVFDRDGNLIQKGER